MIGTYILVLTLHSTLNTLHNLSCGAVHVHSRGRTTRTRTRPASRFVRCGEGEVCLPLPLGLLPTPSRGLRTPGSREHSFGNRQATGNTQKPQRNHAHCTNDKPPRDERRRRPPIRRALPQTSGHPSGARSRQTHWCLRRLAHKTERTFRAERGAQ